MSSAASSWKVSIPFFIFSAITLTLWFFTGNRNALIVAIITLLWGILWGVLATRSAEQNYCARQAPLLKLKAGECKILSRARRGFLGKKGLLLITPEFLLWHATTDINLFQVGQNWTGNTSNEVLVALKDIARWRHVSRLWGGDDLQIHLQNGQVLPLRLLDPEALPLLLEAMGSSQEN